MDKILENFTDPSWWVTGLFFSLLLKYSPKLFGFIREHLRKGARKYLRAREYKYKCNLKNQRHNLAAVQYQSVKSHAYFLMYVIIIALYVVWYAAGPLFQIQKESFSVFILCVSPMNIMQIVWMNQNSKAKELVEEYGKVRVTSQFKRN